MFDVCTLLYLRVKQFECSECGKLYKYGKHLRDDTSKAHPGKVDIIAPPLRNDHSDAYQCTDCERNFGYERSLKRHQRDCHGETSGKKVKCSMCNFEAVSESCYFGHLEAIHDLQIKTEKLQFSSLADFEQWKENTEKRTRSLFVKNHSSHIAADGTVRHYYDCHRSGYFFSDSKGGRLLKLQGSNKICGVCPAKIRVIQNTDGACEVIFVSTHAGHKNELCHLYLTDTEKARIAADISNKIPFEAIMDKIRDSISDSELERIHLLTRQDLYNIERQYNLSSSMRHRNDAASVDAWVHEMRTGDSPCVLFYKPQGTISESHPDLRSSDFVLIIMNSAQSELLKKFGHDCICIDGTHGLNNYDFELTTLLVLDDMRQGFPCAFLISNWNDTQVLSIFFEHVRSEVGKISPTVFMSDLAESFYNAWNSIMDPPSKRLYCTWHVDRAWRRNIINKIKDKEKQAEAYKLVRTLLEERDAVAFEVMLPAALNKLSSDPDTSEFSSYFKYNYLHNAQCWAYCHRLHAGINTNMHIERMHRTIKYIYLKGQNVKRLDKAIFALMSFVKDKLFDRLIVLEKGKITSKVKDIRHRHKLSKKVNADHISKEENGWIVPSSSNVAEMYFIRGNKVDCNCQLRCHECNTCIHKYTCTCIDSSVKWNLCKHILSVCQVNSDIDGPAGTSEDSNELVISGEDASVVSEKQQILAQVSRKDASSDPVSLSQQRNMITSKLLEAVGEISTQKELEVYHTHAASLIAALRAVQNEQTVFMSKNETVGCKRKIVPQRELYSTKKRRSSPHTSLVKPDAAELQKTAVFLLEEQEEPVEDVCVVGETSRSSPQ